MIATALLVAYALVVTGIGFLGYRRGAGEGVIEYSLANRQVGWLGTTLSVFATLLTESVIFFAVSLTARYGLVGSVAGTLGPVLALVAMSLVVARVYRLGVARDYTCISEFCRDQWGPVAGRFARWVLMIFLLWIIVLQINLNGKMLGALLGWDQVSATAMTVGVVLVYLLSGGYRAVIRTDVFQSLLLGALVFLPLVIEPKPDVAGAVRAMTLTPDAFYILAMSFVLTVVRPELWQRVYSAASARVARWSLLGAAGLYSLLVVVVLYYALAIQHAAPDLHHMDAFAFGYQKVLPPAIATLFPVLLIAAMMSSLDSAAFLLSVDLAREGSAGSAGPISSRARKILAVVLVGAGAASLLVFDALSFAYKLNGIVALFAVPILISTVRPVRRPVVVTAIAVGLSIYGAQIVSGRIGAQPSEAVFGAAAVVLIMAGGTAIDRITDRKGDES